MLAAIYISGDFSTDTVAGVHNGYIRLVKPLPII